MFETLIPSETDILVVSLHGTTLVACSSIELQYLIKKWKLASLLQNLILSTDCKLTYTLSCESMRLSFENLNFEHQLSRKENG